jgi:aldehyde:ferredoxin oxidoreductase
MHDPRAMRPMLENYPITPTGGDHTGAGRHRTSLRNTVGLCQFLAYDEPRVTDLVRGATGWDVTDEEMRAVVSRGLSLARLFNMREGITAADDRLPKRLHEPLLKGPLSNHTLAEAEVRSIVTDYYTEQGWDAISGAPLLGTLEALEIADYAAHAPGVVPAGASPRRVPPAVRGTEVEERHEE